MSDFFIKQIGKRFDLWHKDKTDNWGTAGWEFSLHGGLASVHMPMKGYKFKGTFVVKSVKSHTK